MHSGCLKQSQDPGSSGQSPCLPALTCPQVPPAGQGPGVRGEGPPAGVPVATPPAAPTAPRASVWRRKRTNLFSFRIT